MSGSVSASSCAVRRSRRPQTRLETSCTRTGRPSEAPAAKPGGRSAGEGKSHTAGVYACEESIREAEKVFLINLVEDGSHGLLDYFVL